MTAGRLLQRHVRLSAFGQASTQELSARYAGWRRSRLTRCLW
jgi:hypothetical protein